MSENTANPINYRILGVNTHDATMIVHYETITGPGVITMVELELNSSNTLPSGQNLVDLIMKNAPVSELIKIESMYANNSTRTATFAAANADYTLINQLLRDIEGYIIYLNHIHMFGNKEKKFKEILDRNLTN